MLSMGYSNITQNSQFMFKLRDHLRELKPSGIR